AARLHVPRPPAAPHGPVGGGRRGYRRGRGPHRGRYDHQRRAGLVYTRDHAGRRGPRPGRAHRGDPQRPRRGRGALVARPGVAPARGRQARHRLDQTHQDGPGHARRLHAGRGAGVCGDLRGPFAGQGADHDRAQRRHLHQRDEGAGAGRHRPGPLDAGDGGEGRLLPPARQRLGHADPDRYEGRGRVRGDGGPHSADLRGHPPGGHLGARVLRDRAAAHRDPPKARHARRRARHGGGDARRGARRLPTRRAHARGRGGRPDRARGGRVRDRRAHGRRRRQARHRLRPEPPLPRARPPEGHRDLRPRDGDGRGGRRGRDDGPGRPDRPGHGARGPGHPGAHQPVPRDRTREGDRGRGRLRRRRHQREQRPRLPRHLPGRATLRGRGDNARHEARRRQRHSRPHPAVRARPRRPRPRGPRTRLDRRPRRRHRGRRRPHGQGPHGPV
ncbi:MAG: NADP-dependent malic enzyme, partial [uncultured Rubrobacteraceae bacterium]